MTQLVRYETARSALAEARSVDEVKDIRDKSEAMRAYARMAKDTQLEIDATELRLRAERRLGIMLSEQKQTIGMNRGGWQTCGSGEEPQDRIPTLAEVGIDKKLSSRAQRIGGIGEQAFEAMVESVRDRIASGERIGLNITTADKKERRAARERDLASRQAALPNKRYGVIYADPEWRFEVYNRDTGMDRAADNHYPTSSTEDICNRPVADIAADDCVLFLWATVPMLPDALRVMDAWDFQYKSHCVWAKDRVGTGYWFRNQHEILLVGTRGNVPAPAMGTQVESLVDASVGRHSEKPAKFYELIERYFPTLPKIELNARAARPGWDAWGYEAPVNEMA
ncbi:N6-adenosine-specific RNA methylase IME4 [Bradyrhizobium elkanii]|uniref:MT-A70 family methyltransferase n=1 Tax=Bradyrhizobium elkanii TaxID=29448 RepID=UPI002169B119|nr:MT-A70 family methyltransferase [Bradyrhizobium elkanii]MCS3692025.1 N6-adenosine-specific RNA methylase IME4 [Bradyrhizobium elkanii]